MSSRSHLNIAREALFEEWGQSQRPLTLPEDLDVGVQLFFELANKTVLSQTPPKLASDQINPTFSTTDETAIKIKSYVKKYAYDFWDICQSGFPFSKLNPLASTATLQYTFENYCPSPIAQLMTQDKSTWLIEAELNQLYGEPFERLNTQSIGIACFELHEAYKRHDFRSGYYLLWLIKQTSKGIFEIPPKELFTSSTVQEVLSDLIANNFEQIKLQTKFIEVLYSRDNMTSFYLSKKIISLKDYALFQIFTQEQLRAIPMSNWPQKERIIIACLHEKQTLHCLQLEFSLDPKTSEVGKLLRQIFHPSSFNQQISLFHEITELLPSIEESDFPIIFNRPFPAFRHTPIEEFPDFMTPVKFAQSTTELLTYNDFIIGLYMGDPRIPPALLSFNKKTEKMVWGVSLPTIKLPSHPSLYVSLDQVEDKIIVRFKETNKIFFIQEETGEFQELTKPNFEIDFIHISSTDMCYSMTIDKELEAKKLMGGTITNFHWIQSFEAILEKDDKCIPLSTHVGSYNSSKNQLTVFGPTGKSIIIENCISAKGVNNKLILLQKNPNQKDGCMLTVRSMTNDESVVTDIEKTIPLTNNNFYMGPLCNNGQLILFENKFGEEFPVFIDFNTNEVVYSDYSLTNSVYIINKKTSEIWVKKNDEVLKISTREISLMAKLSSDSPLRFIDIDENDHLFFYIP